jgi:CheY-like chemotaxis protein
MKRLLLVDDDALVMRLYRDRLSAHGFQVNTAASGVAALTILRSARPDLVVLDLMMPDLSGVDVLKFIRSEPRLAPVPVVVLTNSYLNELGKQAAAIGIERALLKAQCTPSALMATIDELLQQQAATEPTESSSASPPSMSSAPAQPPATSQPIESRIASSPPSSTPQTPPQPPTPAAAPPPIPIKLAQPEAKKSEPEVKPSEPEAKADGDLLKQAPRISAELRQLFQSLSRLPRNAPEQQAGLQELYRKVHFLAAAAGFTQFAPLTKTAAVFEALLYVLLAEPSRITPSVFRTLASLVDFVELLFRRAGESLPSGSLSSQVLVVDDDPLSNRLVDAALRQAQLNPRSTEDPLVAWQWAHHQHFDLILLDIEMPALNGFELCARLRAVPGYEKTPIIFVTVHGEFETRAKSTLSGGDDLIAKPILPMEVAAKAVMHLVKSQMRA